MSISFHRMPWSFLTPVPYIHIYLKKVNEHGVEILVVAEDDSYASANEIVLMAFNYFSDDYGDVVVTFKDASNIVNS